MKIWLSKNSEVPVREQIITQITLGIVSGDLRVGERLPSTKEISRRFDVHSNTVSNAYQKLAEQGWLEFKKGSGFYVREAEAENQNAEIRFEKLAEEFFRRAAALGFSGGEIEKRILRRFSARAPQKILIVESDAGLREVLIEEIRAATNFQIDGIDFEKFKLNPQNHNALIAALIDEKPKIEPLIAADSPHFYLTARSVSGSMTGETRPSGDDLIAVVSGWPQFLLLAKTILLAARIEPESLILRSTAEKDWQNGLKSASLIICDSLTAKRFPGDERIRVFPVIADESLESLVRLFE